MVFSAIQEQNDTYTFKYMLSQIDKSYFTIEMIKEVELHEN